MSDLVQRLREGDRWDYSSGDLLSSASIMDDAADRIEHLERVLMQARAALEDMNNGWKYIRCSHGDLYGVGWDRAQDKADASIAAINETLHREVIEKR